MMLMFRGTAFSVWNPRPIGMIDTLSFIWALTFLLCELLLRGVVLLYLGSTTVTFCLGHYASAPF